MILDLDTPIDEVAGERLAKALTKGFGIRTVSDLLAHTPRRYAERGELTPISELPVGEIGTIVAVIRAVDIRRMHSRTGKLIEVVISDGSAQMTLTFFNQAWRMAELAPGKMGIFSGKVTEFKGRRQFSHPDYSLFEEGDRDDVIDRAEEYAERPICIYRATSSVPSWQFSRLIGECLDDLGSVAEPVSEAFRAEHKLLRLRDALERVHRPRVIEQAHAARHTLRVHEALVLQTALAQQRAAIALMPATPRLALPGGLLERFDANLPFTLTPDQVDVGMQVSTDLAAARPMNRLVQGEVGSGKTLVALRAMLQAVEDGGQAALIAPTEVLAGQHLRSIVNALGAELAAEVMPTLLTGKMPAADRRRAALWVATGQSRIVIGTHALLSESTTFLDLGLIVIDEQHRFGVEQREALRAKGYQPHVLVLTATPIPRTVAMTVFGDLEVSTLRTMPTGRAGTTTFVAPLAENPGWFGRVWERAAEEIDKGHQVYVVCSAIDVTDNVAAVEDGEEVDATQPPPRWSVESAMDLLSRHPRLSQLRLASLHGRMGSEQKDAVMRAFAAGEIDLLVATTVIEVGVDVHNASMMIILDADRFGMSQLHQLRGRVGRGAVPGLCLLVTEVDQFAPARERVEAVAATQDGFELAEMDLEQRGEGDVLGDSQAGARTSLRNLRVISDRRTIEIARTEAERIVAADPSLREHPGLAQALARRLDDSARTAMRKN